MANAPCLELFPFRYRDPRTGKWVRARYVATREQIADRHAEWEITGPAEIRNVDPEARAFSPFKQMMDAELRRYRATAELQPTIDAVEELLLAVFLRRYVTYCARRGRFAAMNGTARLYAEIDASAGYKRQPRQSAECSLPYVGLSQSRAQLLRKNSTRRSGQVWWIVGAWVFPGVPAYFFRN